MQKQTAIAITKMTLEKPDDHLNAIFSLKVTLFKVMDKMVFMTLH